MTSPIPTTTLHDQLLSTIHSPPHAHATAVLPASPGHIQQLPPTPTTFSLGTRASLLAVVQTEGIRAALQKVYPDSSYDFPIVTMTTAGDNNQTTPLYLLSNPGSSSSGPAKSLWTEELELALLEGKVDVIVHCVKDMPTSVPAGCELACMTEREDPRDALVVKEGLNYKTLAELPEGSIIGTSSVRRTAQLSRNYPKLKFMSVRGNLQTRLRKLDAEDSPYTALILAVAGMKRVDLGHRCTALLSSPDLLAAVGQGALALEIRSGDERVRQAVATIGHWQTEWACGAERGLLRLLEGGCSLPVGVETTVTELEYGKAACAPGTAAASAAMFCSASNPPYAFPTPSPLPQFDANTPLLHLSGLASNSSSPRPGPRKAIIDMTSCVTSLDGTKHVIHAPGPRVIRSWREAERWGEICAEELKNKGGKEVLDEIVEIRKQREEADKAALAQEAQAQNQVQV